MHYLLIYDTAPDYLARRGDFRSAHLKLAWEAAERGDLLLGGAFGDPVEGAMLLFRCNSPELPSAFARNDPYVLNGLVTRWRVAPWQTVVGHDAAAAVRP